LSEFGYTTVGHVSADVLADGSRVPGGSAFYSALQAARLGLRTLVITQGVAGEIEELLEPYRSELELQVLPTLQTTTLQTSGWGAGRRQRMLAWAGPMEAQLTLSTSILHLAPIARETPVAWHGSAEFVGLTPQGLLRDWQGEGAEVRLLESELVRERPPRNCAALVVGENERASAAGVIAAALAGGAVVAVTDGPSATSLLLPDGRQSEVPVPAIADPRDDIGAGDVFASAFFVALADGESPRRAANFATAAAAVRMGGEGPQAIGERRAIEDRLRAVA